MAPQVYFDHAMSTRRIKLLEMENVKLRETLSFYRLLKTKVVLVKGKYMEVVCS